MILQTCGSLTGVLSLYKLLKATLNSTVTLPASKNSNLVFHNLITKQLSPKSTAHSVGKQTIHHLQVASGKVENDYLKIENIICTYEKYAGYCLLGPYPAVSLVQFNCLNTLIKDYEPVNPCQALRWPQLKDKSNVL